MEFSFDMTIVEFDSFETAFPVPPDERDAVARRFMTLFVEAERHVRAGGTSYVCRARSSTGEVFALKRLLAGAGIPKLAVLSEEDVARITQGHAAEFYEEYRNQMLVSQLRGFPKLYGYGSIEGEPAIVMEWVDGVSVYELGRLLAERGEQPSAQLVADLGASVLEVLETLDRLDSTLVHRDISPTNIIIRTDAVPLEDQMASGEFDVCLIDFGSAAAETPAGSTSFTMSAQVWRRGTPEYAPPEMLAQDIPHADTLRKSQTIDVFALCSVLYELYAGCTPWRVAEHPETTPYRLKMENDAEPIEPRSEKDAPLAAAIMAGLAIDQAKRPSVRELADQLSDISDALAESEGRTRRHVQAEEQGGEEPARGEQAVDSGQKTWRRRRLARELPPSLYTPDSTRFRAVLESEGGGRAGDNIPAFVEPTGISRRTFIIGAVSIGAAALIGGALAARSCTERSAHLIDAGLLADAIYAGEPLYPARDGATNKWMLVGGSAAIDLDAGDYEPGRFVNGLIRVYDRTTKGFGFKTPVAGEGGAATAANAAAWAFARTFAEAGDFSAAAKSGGSDVMLAAAKDPESGLWGFIGTNGEYAVHAAYADAGRFANGYAPVRFAQENARWGFVDAGGSEVLGPTFARLGMCSEEGLAAAIDDETGLWGFASIDGSWAIPPAYLHVRRFTEGMAGYFDSEKQRWGFLDAGGTEAIDPTFLDVRPYFDGLAPAQDAKTGLWGLLDAAGAWSVEPCWLSLGEKASDLFPAHGSPANVYDIEGADATAWEKYLATGQDVRFSYGYVSAQGAWVHKPQYGDTLIRASEQ